MWSTQQTQVDVENSTILFFRGKWSLHGRFSRSMFVHRRVTSKNWRLYSHVAPFFQEKLGNWLQTATWMRGNYCNHLEILWSFLPTSPSAYKACCQICLVVYLHHLTPLKKYQSVGNIISYYFQWLYGKKTFRTTNQKFCSNQVFHCLDYWRAINNLGMAKFEIAKDEHEETHPPLGRVKT